MLHSVVIPHRNRNERLKWCLWSIERSARASGVPDDYYEVIIVDGRSDEMPVGPGRTRTILVDHATPLRVTPAGSMRVFSKPRLLNKGIEAAEGDVLTFLDADAIVGSRWMSEIHTMDRPVGARPTRLCYQVRYVAAGDVPPWSRAGDLASPWQRWFDEYDLLQRGFEGYGDPESDGTGGLPVFGNSQFSIHRDDLRDLRFNEDFTGAGYEDLWMIREIWRKHGENYKGVIRVAPERAMLHVKNGRDDWVPDMPNQTKEDRAQITAVLEEITRENRKRYLES